MTQSYRDLVAAAKTQIREIEPDDLEKLAQNRYISAPSMAPHAALAGFSPT